MCTDNILVLLLISAKLRTSKGQNETKKSKLGQFLLGQLGNLLYTLNVCTPCIFDK